MIWKLIIRPIRFFYIIILKLLKKEYTEDSWQALEQFIKFSIVGLSSTLLSYLINIGVLKLLESFKVSWDFYAANIVAFVITVIWSFYWNRKYVFHSSKTSGGAVFAELMKTFMAYAFTGLLLANVLSYVWIEFLSISKYIAPLINLIISVPTNFLINKFWTFKE